jgi:glutamyl-tRNA synthetase
VTHVVRGEDHVANTALQVQMFEALGATPPAFAHEALLVGSEGKLSKRLGSLGVDGMREAGVSRSHCSPSLRGSAPACRSSR